MSQGSPPLYENGRAIFRRVSDPFLAFAASPGFRRFCGHSVSKKCSQRKNVKRQRMRTSFFAPQETGGMPEIDADQCHFVMQFTTVQGKQAKIVSPTQERAILGYLVTTRYPLPGSRPVPVVHEGRSPRQGNGRPDLGHGHRCGRADRGDDPPPEPRQQGQHRRPHHSPHPDLQAALILLQTARGDMAAPDGRPLLGAWRWLDAGHGALVVPSAVYGAAHGRLLVALGPPHLHYPRGAQSVPGRGEPAGRAGARWPYQPRHDATLHRRGHRG